MAASGQGAEHEEDRAAGASLALFYAPGKADSPGKVRCGIWAMRVGGKEKYHDRDPGPLQKTIPPNKEGFVSNLSHLIWANLLLTGFFPDDIHPTD